MKLLKKNNYLSVTGRTLLFLLIEKKMLPEKSKANSGSFFHLKLFSINFTWNFDKFNLEYVCECGYKDTICTKSIKNDPGKKIRKKPLKKIRFFRYFEGFCRDFEGK